MICIFQSGRLTAGNFWFDSIEFLTEKRLEDNIMFGAKQAYAIIAGLSPWLVACGLQTPEMQGFGQKQADEKFYENDLVAQIKCELHKGVLDTLQEHRKG